MRPPVTIKSSIWQSCRKYLSTPVQGHQHFESRRTIYSYFDFDLKNSNFRLHYQRPSSSADCARELFKGSNGSANLVDCTRKKKFLFGGADFL